MQSNRLGPEERQQALHRIGRERFDVLVIGGGVTGCGTALDAAARGLSVALIEQRDWASGTSSRSSKLFHGGLRYLEQFDFVLVHEALREQKLMLETLCPHLTHPVPFLLPLRPGGWQRFYLGAGVLLYDIIAGRRALPRHRHLSRRSALRKIPALRTDALAGAIEYYDAQVDDARHTMTLARTAAAHGATLVSSVRHLEFRKDAGRITGSRAVCLETGQSLEIEASQVINASGVWTDRVQSEFADADVRVRASKGIHLVVPRDRIPGESGLVLRTGTSVLFLIPWKHHWIIGTTDTDWNLDLAHPAASCRDVDYLLETLNQALQNPLTHDDIEGVYAGLRPLLYGESDATSELSRRHAVSQPAPGLVTVAGGKYTTYRLMAKDAVDAAAAQIDRAVPTSSTHQIPLVGADGFEARRHQANQLASTSGLEVACIEHLLSRYGTCIDDLLELISTRPELGEPLPGAPRYLRVEAHYAASHEGALHLDDVLTRRTRISIETFDRGLAAAQPVARHMAEVLGWDAETLERETAHYTARVEAERESQRQPDDRTADAARMGAPDVRTGRRSPNPR